MPHIDRSTQRATDSIEAEPVTLYFLRDRSRMGHAQSMSPTSFNSALT